VVMETEEEADIDPGRPRLHAPEHSIRPQVEPMVAAGENLHYRKSSSCLS
jgi:hypothetical protein